MRRLKALAIGALAAALAVGAGGVASAQMSFVPSSRDVVIAGHGYGHGIGLSQYGAAGAARQGKTWRQIVGFYYPGTAVTSASGPIRVLVTADTTSDVKVSPVAGLSLRDLGDGASWTLPTRTSITRWRINPNRRVQLYENGQWRRWTTPSGRSEMLGDSEFYAAAPIPLWVPSGSGEVAKRYRGRLRSATPAAGATSRDTVNVLPLEQYLRGVVPLEMPASWSSEALKSQAVAARTYAVRLRSANPQRYYQVCDTTACQVYRGADAEDPRTDAAVAAVAGRVLHYGGAPALTMFSSSNGGHTADGGTPYLVAKPDPWDGWSGNPVHDWTKTLSAASIEAAYPALGTLIGLDVVARDGYGEWGGRVETMVLDGTESDVTVTGPQFRFRFDLRSHWFRPAPTAIGTRWSRLGGPDSRVGATRRAESAITGGAVQVFAKGRIYWSPKTRAREVYGSILSRYLQMGGARGQLGFPVTGEVSGGVPGARMNRFQRGRIYWSRATKAHEVYGAILKTYLGLGGPSSQLGLPVTGEYDVPGGRASDFEGGRLVWDRATRTVTVHYD